MPRRHSNRYARNNRGIMGSGVLCGPMQKLYLVNQLDTVSADIFVLKLRFNTRSAYIERLTLPSSKRKPHFETRTCLWENKSLGHGSRGE
jgi:hypothetical protein